MNNFRRDRLIDYWGPKLMNSRSFAMIVELSKMAKNADKKPRTTRATFNKPGENTINIRTYLKTIDP